MSAESVRLVNTKDMQRVYQIVKDGLSGFNGTISLDESATETTSRLVILINSILREIQ